MIIVKKLCVAMTAWNDDGTLVFTDIEDWTAQDAAVFFWSAALDLRARQRRGEPLPIILNNHE